jgi:hypothetical protein
MIIIVVGNIVLFEPQFSLDNSARFAHFLDSDNPFSTSVDYTAVFFFYRAYTSNNKIILVRVVFYAVRVVSITGDYIFPELLVLHKKVVTLASNPQRGRRRLSIYAPQW